MADVKLVVVGGKHAGKEVRVPGPGFIIGRVEGCHLRVHSRQVSRHHAAILIESGIVAVRDLGSRTGTYVNGELVTGDRRLENSDLLKLGPLQLEVELADSLQVKSKPKIKAAEEAATPTAGLDSRPEFDIFHLLGEEKAVVNRQKKRKAGSDHVTERERAATKIYFDANVLGNDKASNIFYPHRFMEGARVELCRGAVLGMAGKAGSEIGSRLHLVLTLEDAFSTEGGIDDLVTNLAGRLHNNVAKLRIGGSKIPVGKGVGRVTIEHALKGAILDGTSRQEPI